MFEVHDDCWDSFKLFRDLETQWRFAEGIPTGLDYGAVQAVLRLRRLRPWPTLFDDLRLMEQEMPRLSAEQRKREAWRNR